MGIIFTTSSPRRRRERTNACAIVGPGIRWTPKLENLLSKKRWLPSQLSYNRLEILSSDLRREPLTPNFSQETPRRLRLFRGLEEQFYPIEIESRRTGEANCLFGDVWEYFGEQRGRMNCWATLGDFLYQSAWRFTFVGAFIAWLCVLVSTVRSVEGKERRTKWKEPPGDLFDRLKWNYNCDSRL